MLSLDSFIQAYGISTNTQLANFASTIGLPLIEINFAEDITIDNDGAYIVNLGDKIRNGTHWTGLWIEGDNAFYYDSYGVAPEDILIEKIHAYNPNIKLAYNDGYEFQLFEEELCGMWVMMFFYFMHKYTRLSLSDRFKKMANHYLDTIV